MKLLHSKAVAPALEILDEAGSTNDVLVAQGALAADFAVVVTDNQTAGRGRLGRVWVAPPGKCLAISVLLRPATPEGTPFSLEHFGWLPLIAGVAMGRAVASVVEQPVGLKWPNDVQIDGHKVSGLLAELLPSGDAVVLGAGVNLFLGERELPTPVSTSLQLAGAQLVGDELADAVLSTYLTELRDLYTRFIRAAADPDSSGIRDAVTAACVTLGQQVRVQLPAGDDLLGTATSIDGNGRLRVRRSSDGLIVAVAAGDVTHLRYE